MQDVVDELTQSYTNREILLKAQKDVRLDVDATLFEVAVKNLIENALKYSEDEVEVVLTNKALLVEDKGIGIAQEELEKITTKFYRVSRNGWDNSLGIGLSLVTHIVRVHGFKLKIESEKAKGSKFSILFD